MSSDVSTDVKAIESVRHELKIWEWQFRQANGRKPGRDDVKNNVIISAKYEEYDRLSGRSVKTRNLEKTGSVAEGKDVSRVLRERSGNTAWATPKKVRKRSTSMVVAADDKAYEEEEEEEEEQPTPACVRFALGPTPQKDGAILGLFDMLPSDTPTKDSAMPAENGESVVEATPSKASLLRLTTVTGSGTPQSSSKRDFLDVFRSTPLKRKRADDSGTPSTSKRQYATPAFLRRSHTLPIIGDDGEEETVVALPSFRKRGLVRSLSAIIHGLRKQQDERMDDEWDVMNELEAEERGEIVRPIVPRVLVEDSQAVDMPLGPDQSPHSDDEVQADDNGTALGPDGQPRKAWKKKGLKRQTRRVVMRPVLHKPKKTVYITESESQDHKFSEHEDESGVAEAGRQASNNQDDESYDLRDDSEHDQKRSTTRRKSAESNKKKAAKSTSGEAQSQEEERKKTKKGNALAHMNFRALKIKNKNSKAKGRGRKFGRR